MGSEAESASSGAPPSSPPAATIPTPPVVPAPLTEPDFAADLAILGAQVSDKYIQLHNILSAACALIASCESS